MKHLFVVNPVAGKQKPEEKLRLINEAIDRLPAEQRSRDEFEIYVTEAPMDACRHIRETAADGAELRVYACGGDGTLNEVVKSLYGPEAVTRFRPHHFPFTEPSCEMDVQCHKCGGKGCPTCKGEGWIEVLGAGMIHPKVLEGCGIDSTVYSGWAFGMGLERLALGHFKISDLRLIFENDVRFLEQF